MVLLTAAGALTMGGASRPLSRHAGLAYAARMDPAPEDCALMLRYRDGDVAAFEVLYRRHKDPLYRYLLRRCCDRATAEDVFQDVWGKIVKARENYRPRAKFTTYLYHVAQNCFVDHLRRSKKHSRNTETEPDSRADPAEQPDVLTEKHLARRRLETALRNLPDEQRDVFLLHEEAGLCLDDIAFVTACNRETVKSRLRYAVKKLRSSIDEPSETA